MGFEKLCRFSFSHFSRLQIMHDFSSGGDFVFPCNIISEYLFISFVKHKLDFFFIIIIFRWLKKKNLEAKRHRQEEKQRARMHRLAARKSRKSIALAKAIKQTSSFKYVDYYGYRF